MGGCAYVCICGVRSVHILLLYTVVYYCILLCTIVYCCVLLYTVVYYCILLCTIVYLLCTVHRLDVWWLALLSSTPHASHADSRKGL